MDADPIVSASRDGRLIMAGGRKPHTRVGWFDRLGTLQGTLTLPAGAWDRPVLSPDNRHAAIVNGGEIWRVDLARSVAARLTSNGAFNYSPVWSPDGSQIAFTMTRRGTEEIHVMNSDGSGESRPVTSTADLFKNPECWTRDGIVFMNMGAGTVRDLWIAPAAGGGKPAPLIQTSFSEFRARVSPDGRWIGYISNEGGSDDLYIQSCPITGHKVRVSTTGAERLWWMPDSEVCYRLLGGDIMGVTLTPRGDDLDVGEPRLLFRLPPDVIFADISHDGQRVIATYSGAEAQPRNIRVILNWTALMKS
jgi:eukaryotic-like serine/threonine-protein kinase